MRLQVLHLQHDLLSVALLLVREDIEFVLLVFLQEDVVLVEHLDSLVNLQYFASLHILEVHLPLGRLLGQSVDLALQVADLTLDKLLEGAHDFLDSGHLLRHCVVGLAGVLQCLLLYRVYFADHVLKRHL